MSTRPTASTTLPTKAASPTTTPTSTTTGNCSTNEGNRLIVALDATPLTLTSGGLLRYVSELSLALAREFPADTYTLMSDQPFAIPNAAPPNLLRGPAPEGRRWWLSGVRRAIRQTGAHLFHGTNFEVPIIGGTPAVVTIHDLSPWRNPEWHPGAGDNSAARVRTRTPWLLRLGRARLILTVSEAVRREITAHFGIAESRIRAVPLAASPLFEPTRHQAPESPFFLFIGTLEPRKNIAALIEAWRATRHETRADLIIAGRTRSDFAPIEPEAGLKLLGEVPEHQLPALYSNALAFVYPSHYEGFGLPILEAMQCGCPVITSHDPAIKEVAGTAALHTSSAHEIGEALRQVAQQPSLRRQLRDAGLKRARLFSWQRTAQATRAVYTEALKSGALA